eukprot:tig00020710_g13233.t3
MVPVLLPCPLHRRSPSFSASGSAPFGTGTQCSSRFIGARPWLTRALLPAASGSLFCSVPLGAPMYRSCQGRGRDAEDGSWDAPPRAREFPRASSLEMGAFRNSVGSRGTPSFSCKPDLSLCDLRLRLQASFAVCAHVYPEELEVCSQLRDAEELAGHVGLGL